MAKKAKVIKCKKCDFSFTVGTDSEPEIGKQWSLTSPMPDKDGNITITMMATWKCPKCGYTIRGARGKTKGDFEGKSKKQKIDDILESGEEFVVKDFAENELGVDPENFEKILGIMIKKGQAKGEIKKGKFIPN